jgi:hypothetical protein
VIQQLRLGDVVGGDAFGFQPFPDFDLRDGFALK